MIRFYNDKINIMQTLIGYSITSCSSDKLAIYPTEIVSYERRICLSFKRNKDFRSFFVTGNFVEDDDAYTYYDFVFNEIERVSEPYTNAQIFLETSPVKSIKIYGRTIGENISLAEWRNIETDDVFVFDCRDGEQLALVFHPFTPDLQLLLQRNVIKRFFEGHKNTYLLRHTLTG